MSATATPRCPHLGAGTTTRGPERVRGTDVRPADAQLATEHCQSIEGGAPTETTLSGRPAWQCRSIEGNEMTTERYTFVGPKLGIVRGVENASVPIFSYQSVVDSVVIYAPD